jgi:hypothetical protein
MLHESNRMLQCLRNIFMGAPEPDGLLTEQQAREILQRRNAQAVAEILHRRNAQSNGEPHHYSDWQLLGSSPTVFVFYDREKAPIQPRATVDRRDGSVTYH